MNIVMTLRFIECTKYLNDTSRDVIAIETHVWWNPFCMQKEKKEKKSMPRLETVRETIIQYLEDTMNLG